MPAAFITMTTIYGRIFVCPDFVYWNDHKFAVVYTIDKISLNVNQEKSTALQVARLS